MPRLEKFSENALKASSSRNRTLEGEGSEDEEASERKGVPGWSGFTIRCHRHDQRKQKERERKKRQSEKSQAASNIPSILKRKYVCMGNA